MTTAYTSLLGLALPVTGELAGTWGDTVNDYITKYLDASVAGTQTISGSQTAVTLSVTTNANLSQVGSGATGSAQYNIINCTGNPASMLTVTVPAASKTYVVVNATSTNQQVKIVGAGPTTGVTLDAGEKAVIAWNGSDFIKIATSAVDGVSTISFGTTGLTPSTATSGAVTVAGTLVAANGGTGQSTYATGDLLYATGSTALSKLGIGTNGQILTSTGTAPQWSTLSGVAVTTFSAGTTGFTPSVATSGAITLAGTLATTNGGTGLTSFTANRVFYASSTSAIGQSANLTFDGTTLTANALTTTSTVTLNGGTANGVAYLNGSKVLTTGSALTFDGTNFRAVANARIEGTGIGITGTGDGAEIYSNSGITYFEGLNRTSSTYIPVIISGGTYIAQTLGGFEQMRLTSTGLGIGTTSINSRLVVQQANNTGDGIRLFANGNDSQLLTRYVASIDAWQVSASYASTGAYKPIAWFTSDVERMRLDASGNLGLGVTPGAWTTYRAMDIGGGQSVFSYQDAATNTVGFAANALWNGSWVYRQSSVGASRYQLVNNAHNWFTAPSGTAGNAISFTQAMTLDASGNLVLGTTSALSAASGRTDLTINGSSIGAIISFGNGGVRKGYIWQDGTDLYVANQASGSAIFITNNAERARIPSAGGFVVGTAALATNATTGFLYVPTCAGTPTGTPATQTGTAPIVVDTTNNKLYFYSGGQWRDAGP